MHTPSAIEIGIAESGQLVAASAPELSAGADQAHLQPATLHLALDFTSMNAESVVLQAAAANAHIQLGEDTALNFVIISICCSSVMQAHPIVTAATIKALAQCSMRK